VATINLAVIMVRTFPTIPKVTIMQVSDSEIEFFLNLNWEIIGSCPNPSPEPYIYFFIKKLHPFILTKKDRESLISQSRINLN
jgi:hypothetical protein